MFRMSGQYAVVVFPDPKKGDSVDVVPVCWLDGDSSYWAPYKNTAAWNKSVIGAEKPNKKWPKYPCRILSVKG